MSASSYEFAETIDLCGRPKRFYFDRESIFETLILRDRIPWYESFWFRLRFKPEARPIQTKSSGGTIQYSRFGQIWWFYEPRLWYQWLNRVRSSLGGGKK